jgi:predicted transcriptional regulator
VCERNLRSGEVKRDKVSFLGLNMCYIASPLGDVPMPKTTTLTIRISAEIKDRLEKLATKHHRSKAYLAVQTLERYLDDGPPRKHDRDRVLAIQKANERAPAGDERNGRAAHGDARRWQ